MNKYISILFIVFISACSTATIRNDSSINFNRNEYDFGSLQYKKDAECNFEFSNSGETPLVIYEVKTSCGCTVPEWTKKPIKPGKSGVIKIKYDADFPGVFHKTITVYYNGKDSPAKLSIKGEVEYPDDLDEEQELDLCKDCEDGTSCECTACMSGSTDCSPTCPCCSEDN